MITLNGQSLKLPCKAISLGLDMQCHHCVTDCTILSVDAEEDKVIIESEGIKIRFRMKDLDDFYVATKENRDMLQAQCRKEYVEWKEAVNKEWESKGLKKPFNNED
jgi:hypothetical protein